MKKFLVVIAFVVLSTINSVNAQNYYAGASFAVSAVSVFDLTDDFFLPTSIHIGASNLGHKNFGARLDGSFLINTSDTDNTVFGVGLSGIYSFTPYRNLPLDVYVGVGPRLLIIDDSDDNDNNTTQAIEVVEKNDATVEFGAGALLGVNYHVLPQIGVFGEVRSDIYFTDPVTSQLSFGVGARYYF